MSAPLHSSSQLAARTAAFAHPAGTPSNHETLMTNRTTLEQLRGMDARQVAGLPIAHLALLLDEVGELKADAKRLADLLNDALHARFSEAAAALRRGDGKDTGRARLEVDEHELLADLPKRVEWDQQRLAAALATLQGWGEDPADYVTTEIRIPEARFTAWPPKLQALFAPARTVSVGRPAYSLRRIAS
jgi:hypothetical protein